MDEKICNQEGTSNITITGNRLSYKLTTDFRISNQPEFFNALDRHYLITEIKQKGNSAIIYLRCDKKQSSTIVEDVNDIFEEYYVEQYT